MIGQLVSNISHLGVDFIIGLRYLEALFINLIFLDGIAPSASMQ
jgi:hypothetical protein